MARPGRVFDVLRYCAYCRSRAIRTTRESGIRGALCNRVKIFIGPWAVDRCRRIQIPKTRTRSHWAPCRRHRRSLHWRGANRRPPDPARIYNCALSGMRDDGRRRRGIRADGDRPSAGSSGRGGSDDPGNGSGRGRIEGEGRRGSACRCRVRAARRTPYPRSSSRLASAFVTRRSTISSPKRRTLLRDVELQYVFTGKGKRQALRGRPVAFALWSEVEAGVDRRPNRAAASADQVETRQEAPGLSHPHARYRGAAREGHRRRAADVRLLPGRGALEGLRAQVPGVRQQARQAQAVGRRRPDREAHRLSTLHRRHLRSGVSSAAARNSWSPPPARRSRSCVSRRCRARPFRASCSPMPFLCRSSRHLRSSSRPTTGITSRSRRSPSTRC